MKGKLNICDVMRINVDTILLRESDEECNHLEFSNYHPSLCVNQLHIIFPDCSKSQFLCKQCFFWML